MKLKRALIRNFKGVREVDIDFTRDDGSLRPLTALVGDNGSGKTTVLQAIALTLSLATKQTEDSLSFRWPGFHADRIESLGPTRIELDVVLTRDERQAAIELSNALDPDSVHLRGHVDRLPPGEAEGRLVFEAGRLAMPRSQTTLDLFAGRDTLYKLERKPLALQRRRTDVGGVFWFTQLRSLAESAEDEATAPRPAGRAVSGSLRESWDYNVGQLRQALMQWWSHHKSEIRNGTPDVIAELQQRLDPLFPGLRFVGPAPRSPEAGADPMGWHFFLERNGRRYDIAEMSSGEQAIFPLLWAFVRLSIARSVVLIDELELHLHPPEQQALLTSLRKIGPDCQFIITTHSPYLTRVLGEDEVVRLEEGRVCA